MPTSIFLNLGLLLVTGLLFSLLAARFSLPRVAVYALAGLIWSQDLLGGVTGLSLASGTEALTSVRLRLSPILSAARSLPGSSAAWGKRLFFARPER